MPENDAPRAVLVRHGETVWSRDGRHTGRTDIPLTDRGREDARRLAPRLAGHRFARVLVSPLQRARETCALAGLADREELCPALMEWDYGDYEGLTSAQLRERRPDSSLWRAGCPDGAARARGAWGTTSATCPPSGARSEPALGRSRHRPPA